MWLVYPSTSASGSDNLGSLDHKQQSHKKMEPFWFFRLQFCRTYDSAYNSDFLFSQGHKRSFDSAYDSDSDSIAGENQP